MSKKIWFSLVTEGKQFCFPRSAVTAIESARKHTEQEAGTEPVAGHFSTRFSRQVRTELWHFGRLICKFTLCEEKKCVQRIWKRKYKEQDFF